MTSADASQSLPVSHAIPFADFHSARHAAYSLTGFPEVKKALLTALDLMNSQKRALIFSEAIKASADMASQRRAFEPWFELGGAQALTVGRLGFEGSDILVACDSVKAAGRSGHGASMSLMLLWSVSLLRLPSGAKTLRDQAATLLGNMFRIDPSDMKEPIDAITSFWSCLLPFDQRQAQKTGFEACMKSAEIFDGDPSDQLLLWVGALSYEPWACPDFGLHEKLLLLAAKNPSLLMPKQPDAAYDLGEVAPNADDTEMGRVWRIEEDGLPMPLLEAGGHRLFGEGHAFTWGLFLSLCRMDLADCAISLGIDPRWEDSAKILALAASPERLSPFFDPLDENESNTCMRALARCEARCIMAEDSQESDSTGSTKSKSI